MIRLLKAFVFVSVLAIGGCGGQSDVRNYDAQTKGEMLNFGRHYLSYHAENVKSPAQLEDLKDKSSEFPNLDKQIRSGEFVVVWNAALADQAPENAKFVLGYQKAVPRQFGWVLLGDGEVTSMTAEEFEKTQMALISRSSPASLTD